MCNKQEVRASRVFLFMLYSAHIIFLGLSIGRSVSAQATNEKVTFFPSFTQPAIHNLVIAGPTDTAIFSQLITRFQQFHPTVSVQYHDIGTLELYDRIINQDINDVDLVISSATHLQLKLVNDGHALTYSSPLTEDLPDWAQWRNKLFGFTLEPITFVYNKDLPPEYKPRTRSAFLQAIEKDPIFWRSKTSTYDIAKCGLGYLLAVYDERTSSNFWGMANALGHTATQLYATTGEILDEITKGNVLVGYNVLGSYALARQAQGDPIEVIIPEDYVIIFSRTAFISKHSTHPELAGKFIDFLLSDEGQKLIDERLQLGALIKDTSHQWPTESLHEIFVAPIQPITIGPGLLASLDETRKQRFIKNWTRLITDTPDLATPSKKHK